MIKSTKLLIPKAFCQPSWISTARGLSRKILKRSFSTSPSDRRVVITGLGIVCPLGVGVPKVWKRLINGESGIVKLEEDGYKQLPCRIAARIPKDDLNLEERFTKSELKNLSIATTYSLVAAQEALEDSGLLKEDSILENAGVAVGQGMVDLQDISDVAQTFDSGRGYRKVNPFFVTRILINIPAGHISMKYKLMGPNHSVSTACTTGVHSIGDASNFIRLNQADVMLAGGTEAAINPLSIASFCRIRALATDFNDDPTAASRPFDAGRSGFVMGEGSAMLVLEELSHAVKRGAKIYGEVTGYGLSGDANHVTAPREDGKGAAKCMLAAIRNSCCPPDTITHVNAHATSTAQGDEAELSAITSVFSPDHAPNVMVTSTKSSIGHLLGAAGSAEALFTIMACHTGVLPPTLNLENPVTTKLDLVAKEAREWKQKERIALCNSFGFGGTNASLLIKNFYG